MKKISFNRARKIVEQFPSKKILVLGDLMLDKYIWGDVERISPEAPVPVVNVRRESRCLGGAGNVACNLEKLGSSPIVTGVVGKDTGGDWIRKHLKVNKGIFTADKRPTTVKTRIIAHQQQVVRVDVEEKTLISSNSRQKIINFIKNDTYDGILISDYSKGIISKELTEDVLSFAKNKNIPVFVDPKVNNLAYFSPITLITPNHFEAEQIVSGRCQTEEEIEKAGKDMLSRIETEYVIIKRGEKGMSVFEKKNPVIHIPGVAKEVYDVTGAGDTVIATASLALLSGADINEAAILSNMAAGIVVGKIGTASLTIEELLSLF